ncbi:GH18722 [Drosophila grimshawi]|uniref:GH18722 n=1 Tax=Drosophila grimshawi TaxID=7222 RepID=B4JGP1_DROGR|nr:GH18722 [Drosophila grimshawi]
MKYLISASMEFVEQMQRQEVDAGTEVGAGRGVPETLPLAQEVNLASLRLPTPTPTRLYTAMNKMKMKLKL